MKIFDFGKITFSFFSRIFKILDLEMAKVVDRLKGKEIGLKLDERARDFLVEKGYDPQYGARPMRRAVERYLEDPLAEEILRDIVHDGDPVEVSADDEKLTFSQKASATEAVSGQ